MHLVLPLPLFFDRRTDNERERLVEKQSAEKTKKEKRLFCAGCRHVITHQDERIQVQGGHAHTFTNPHGYTFHIGCFGQAKGCVTTGAGTTEWSWFQGYSWRIALCRHCQGHLGWRYHAQDESFYGLILDRLTSVGGKAA